MYCNYCGTLNDDDSVKCHKCGKSIYAYRGEISEDTAEVLGEDHLVDEYWEDPKEEIEEEIYSIPKENLLKIIGSIFCLLLIIIWFVANL